MSPVENITGGLSVPAAAGPVVAALHALVDGDRAAAAELTASTDPALPLLSTALHRYLSGTDSGQVYDAPAAFEAFILGGGNVGLYRAVSAVLADGYRNGPSRSVLDIGCGNGHALAPALAQAPGAVRTVTLVEPSAALLATAVDRLRREQPELEVVTHNQTLDQFLDAAGDDHFDLVQSTFALHAIPTAQRTELLGALAARTDRLHVIDFDHTELPPGTSEHLRFLATSYERGLAEYVDDRDLVAQGFLMGVLIGQLDANAPRFTWEQPAADWSGQVRHAGFGEVAVASLHDYWSSPAFSLTAVGASS